MGFYKIGLGTWGIGNSNENYQKECEFILHAVQSGIYHIDTAEAYADGNTERLVGDAISNFPRNKLFIASKVRDTFLNYSDVLYSCENSLKRLKTEYLDLFYIHKPNLNIPIPETARALNKLYHDKLILNVGLSNCSIATVQEYQKYLCCPIFAVQCQYNLIAREPQKSGLLDFCKKEKIHFVAYRPLQPDVVPLNIRGLLNSGVYPLLDDISRKYGISTAQAAILWLIQQENVYAVFKTTNKKHLQEMLDIKNMQIGREDIELLTKNFPLQTDVSFTMKKYFSLI